jgi:hypothetical protein
VPVKNVSAAKNGKARAVTVKYAHGETIRLGKIDLRFTMGRRYRARIAALTSHLGGDLTTPQAVLVDQAARFHLLTGLAWDALTKHGAYRHGSPTPANDAYRRAAADERSVLLLLGLDRKAKDVPELSEYLASKRLTFKGRSKDAVDAEEVR